MSLPAADYVDYLSPKYREHAAGYFDFIERHHALFPFIGYPRSAEVLELIDTRGAIRSGGEASLFDPARRIRETEAEGVVAEFLNPNSPLSSVPFWGSLYDLSSPELRAAGADAHNRWLKEFCSFAPDRLLGVYLTYPWPDIDDAVRQCEFAAEAEARAVIPAQQAGTEGDLPGLFDPFYDRFWAACQDLDLAVHIHAGHGHQQGAEFEIFDRALKSASDDDKNAIAGVLDTFVERKPLWQLMWGGVLDRFPRLKVTFLEIHFDWVPGTLDYLEEFAKTHDSGMKLTPRQYWDRHFAIGASIMRYTDVAARHEVGIDKVMFGTDFPHPESSWPNTWDFIRTTMGQLPESEVRKILGASAVDHYRLDRGALNAAALRCGPLPADLLGAEYEVDPRMVNHFDERSGLGKPANLHWDRFTQSVADDFVGAMSARST